LAGYTNGPISCTNTIVIGRSGIVNVVSIDKIIVIEMAIVRPRDSYGQVVVSYGQVIVGDDQVLCSW